LERYDKVKCMKKNKPLISIENLDKARLLLELYNHALSQGSAYEIRPQVQIISKLLGFLFKGKLELAKKEVESQNGSLSFDYVDLGMDARRLCVDISGTEMDPTVYDLLHGEGCCQEVVNKVRAQMADDPYELETISISESSTFQGHLHHLSRVTEDDKDDLDHQFAECLSNRLSV
jgi:hypothetical protein